MMKCIYDFQNHDCKISVFCEREIKTWSGWFFMHDKSTKEKVLEIINHKHKIEKYSAIHSGDCIATGTEGSMPIKVFFVGNGPLSVDKAVI